MTNESTDEVKEFRAFNSETHELTYFDFFDLSDGSFKLDFTSVNDSSNIIITSFAGRFDNNEVKPVPLYEADVIQVITPNILSEDEVKIGVIEFSPNYSAYGIIFQDTSMKLLHECYENTLIKLGNTFEEPK